MSRELRPSIVLAIFFLILGIGLIDWCTGIDSEEHFDEAFDEAMDAETKEDFINSTDEMKEHSHSTFKPKIEHIERELSSDSINLSQAKSDLSFRVSRHDNTHARDGTLVVFGILSITLSLLLFLIYFDS